MAGDFSGAWVAGWEYVWARRLLERMKRKAEEIKDTVLGKAGEAEPPETKRRCGIAQPEAGRVKILDGSRPATKIMTRMTGGQTKRMIKSGTASGRW